MKRIRMYALVAILAAGFSGNILAQENKPAQGQNNPQNWEQIGQQWKARMASAKVGFITNELNLTTAEAQKFWPVYNDISAKKDKALEASAEAFRKLDQAVKDGKESTKLLDEYVKAQQVVANLNAEAVKAYGKVLPADKVAKLFVLEENFRRNIFGRLQGGHNAPGPRPGMGAPNHGGMPRFGNGAPRFGDGAPQNGTDPKNGETPKAGEHRQPFMPWFHGGADNNQNQKSDKEAI